MPLPCLTHRDDDCWQTECRILDHPQYAQAWINQLVYGPNPDALTIARQLRTASDTMTTRQILDAYHTLEQCGVVYWNRQEHTWHPTPSIG